MNDLVIIGGSDGQLVAQLGGMSNRHGLVTGATLTLFMATAVDAPTDATLDRARAQLERLWESLIDTTSDSLFGAAEAIPAGTRPAEDGSAARPASPFLPEIGRAHV